METPVIAIFSRKNPGISPTRWKPVGIRSFYLHKDVGCRNCLAHNCVKEFLCLSAITPQEVFKKAQEILVSM
jgi:ADP-heptose:LPS heptosyltransferase